MPAGLAAGIPGKINCRLEFICQFKKRPRLFEFYFIAVGVFRVQVESTVGQGNAGLFIEVVFEPAFHIVEMAVFAGRDAANFGEHAQTAIALWLCRYSETNGWDDTGKVFALGHQMAERIRAANCRFEVKSFNVN